jgi:hypothetical protein
MGKKYDDASWHYGGDFPEGLPPEAGGIHIGMFVAWALLSGLGGEIHTDEPGHIDRLAKRATTPGAFFMAVCDEKFTSEDLNDEGNAFAESYYDGKYLEDYGDAFLDALDNLYQVPDAWDSYDWLKPMLDRRLAKWRTLSPRT